MRISVKLICVMLSCAAVLADVTTYLQPGDRAPEFKLQTIEKNEVSLQDFVGKIVVLEWLDPSCSYAKKHYDSGSIPSLQKKYKQYNNVVWLTLLLGQQQEGNKIDNASFQLFDDQRQVASLYDIHKSPAVVIIDQAGYIAYIGAIDTIRSPDIQDVARAKKNYIADTLDSLIAKVPVDVAQTKPYGCNISYSLPDNFKEVV